MELVKVELLPAPEKLFQTEKTLENVLAEIDKQARSFVPDMSTAKGRKDIASIAYKVAQSKTIIDNLGKDLVSKWKEQAKIVDGKRRTAREFLDNLKDEIRAPLTRWETEEKERVEKIREKLAGIESFSDVEGMNSAEISDRMLELGRIKTDEGFDEFEKEAQELKQRILKSLIASHETVSKAEKEKEELERLRKEKAEREAAEEKKRIETEAKKRAEEEAAKKVAAEREKRIAAEKAQKEAAERAEREKQEAIEAERRKAKEEADRKEHERLEAEKRKRERIEQEKKKEADALAKREADKKHRAKIKKEATRFIKGIKGTTQEQADAIFDAIAYGDVPHIKVVF